MGGAYWKTQLWRTGDGIMSVRTGKAGDGDRAVLWGLVTGCTDNTRTGTVSCDSSDGMRCLRTGRLLLREKIGKVPQKRAE